MVIGDKQSIGKFAHNKELYIYTNSFYSLAATFTNYIYSSLLAKILIQR